MYKVSNWLKVVEFNQSPIFSTGSYTRRTKLYKGAITVKGATMCMDSA
jgi:hypothetical protein